jgi:hypothetical protein
MMNKYIFSCCFGGGGGGGGGEKGGCKCLGKSYGRNTFALSFLVAVWVLLIVVLLACLYRNGRLSIEEGRI